MSFSFRKLKHRLNNLTIQTGNLSRMEALDRSTRIVMPVPVDESRFENTRLNWSRENACKNLNINPKSVLEIGTLAGDFADFLIQLFSPETTVLVDYFEASDYVFGVQRFTPQTHLDFVKQRFKDQPSVELLKGESSIVLEKMLKSKRKFDFIYIDAGHTYNDVSRDLELAHQLLNRNGIIGMNDYIMTDYYYDTVYGVVQATNTFLESHPNYTVEAFAFNNNLFSDIYLRNN